MLNNIKLLLEACQKLSINYEILHRHQNLVRIKLNQNYYYFVNYSTPFNSKSVTEIFKDKEYTYELLKNTVKIPKTIGFFHLFVLKNTKNIWITKLLRLLKREYLRNLNYQ